MNEIKENASKIYIKKTRESEKKKAKKINTKKGKRAKKKRYKDRKKE